jgi:dTMP kinase
MFITLEGPEGSGKTSQIIQLAQFLRHDLPDSGMTAVMSPPDRQKQAPVVFITREPGGTAISDQVRAILTSMKNTGMNPRAETLLFCAARAQLVEEELRPRLQRGEIVLCDRYADSTLAYQGYGHGNDLGVLRTLLDFATGGLRPDLTLLLDLPVEEGMRRKHSGGSEWNRMDAYEVGFHQRVRQGYLELVRQEPRRWLVIDASGSPEMVQLALRQAVAERLV